MPATAKIVAHGSHQSVHLPTGYRFVEKEVYIRKDPQTGDVILSRKPASWAGFVKLLEEAQADVPPDFLTPETRDQGVQARDPFADWPP